MNEEQVIVTDRNRTEHYMITILKGWYEIEELTWMMIISAVMFEWM